MTKQQSPAEYYVKTYKIGWYHSGEKTHVFIPMPTDGIFHVESFTRGRSWEELVLSAIGFYLKETSTVREPS